MDDLVACIGLQSVELGLVEATGVDCPAWGVMEQSSWCSTLGERGHDASLPFNYYYLPACPSIGFGHVIREKGAVLRGNGQGLYRLSGGVPFCSFPHTSYPYIHEHNKTSSV